MCGSNQPNGETRESNRRTERNKPVNEPGNAPTNVESNNHRKNKGSACNRQTVPANANAIWNGTVSEQNQKNNKNNAPEQELQNEQTCKRNWGTGRTMSQWKEEPTQINKSGRPR